MRLVETYIDVVRAAVDLRFKPARFAQRASREVSVDGAQPGQNLFSFDPTTGPGNVLHCHILDHEDNEMMHPYLPVSCRRARYGPARRTTRTTHLRS